jgi:CRP-like cAMP-binding protein
MTQGDEGFDDFFSADDAAPSNTAFESEISVPPRLGMLADLTPEEFSVVARSAQLKHLEAEKPVFAQGDDADRFFILIDGHVRIERDGELLATLGPGSFFGESALLVGGKRSASVTTSEPSSIWSVDYAAFSGVVSRQLFKDKDLRKEVDERLDSTSPEHFT